MNDKIRLTLDLTGILQGVGFRPFLVNLAKKFNLSGWVRNQSDCVRLVLIGEKKQVENFLFVLPENLPPAARLDHLDQVSIEEYWSKKEGVDFKILESKEERQFKSSIPADLAICKSCAEEIFDPSSRYYGYAFTTCTDCGPRYTVVESVPYDRQRTTMRDFPLCQQCMSEYTESANRRFHAQSIACQSCGPKLWVYESGQKIQVLSPISYGRKALSKGKIVALLGMGGFLLAVDALNYDSISLLRKKKQRSQKPFAVMASSIESAKKYCIVDQISEKILKSSTAPVVLLKIKEEHLSNKAIRAISSDLGTLGVMLASTALQMLLSKPLLGDDVAEFELLVMTSGNKRGEPICTSNEEAIEKLDGIADLFLCHNRRVHFRCDDSVVKKTGDNASILRLARGYAPFTLKLEDSLNTNILAMGADLKNTVSLGFEKEIVMSPHIGDLETVLARDEMERVIELFPQYFKKNPQEVAIDLHPDMFASRVGKKYAQSRDLKVLPIQHHHAHAASCMAEYGLTHSLALVFDGTGWGLDENIWGGELLYVYPGGFDRLGTFAPVPLPGGDMAVLHPVRQLIGRWVHQNADVSTSWLERLKISEKEMEIWQRQCKSGLNSPMTHSVGRLFDAFSTMLGIAPFEVTFEGFAAMKLEVLAQKNMHKCSYQIPYFLNEKNNMLVVDFSKAFTAFAGKFPPDDKIGLLAAGFHKALIEAGVSMGLYGQKVTGCENIVLSGGVMVNSIIAQGLNDSLKNKGFKVFLPRFIPVNDAGISVGQVYVAKGSL